MASTTHGENKSGMPPTGDPMPPPYSMPTPGLQHQVPAPGQSHPAGYVYAGHPGVSYGNPPILLVGPHVVLGPLPTALECPNCKTHVVTQIQYDSGNLTWLAVGVLCLFGCWFGCCLIPTCIDDCKDVLHTCPNCKTFVGRYKRLS